MFGSFAPFHDFWHGELLGAAGTQGCCKGSFFEILVTWSQVAIPEMWPGRGHRVLPKQGAVVPQVSLASRGLVLRAWGSIPTKGCGEQHRGATSLL